MRLSYRNEMAITDSIITTATKEPHWFSVYFVWPNGKAHLPLWCAVKSGRVWRLVRHFIDSFAFRILLYLR
jgi:hypothetical protein